MVIEGKKNILEFLKPMSGWEKLKTEKHVFGVRRLAPKIFKKFLEEYFCNRNYH